MQEKYALGEAARTETNVSATRVEQVQRMAEKFAASTRVGQKFLTDLHAKISTPSEWFETSHDDFIRGQLGSRGPT